MATKKVTYKESSKYFNSDMKKAYREAVKQEKAKNPPKKDSGKKGK